MYDINPNNLLMFDPGSAYNYRTAADYWKQGGDPQWYARWHGYFLASGRASCWMYWTTNWFGLGNPCLPRRNTGRSYPIVYIVEKTSYPAQPLSGNTIKYNHRRHHPTYTPGYPYTPEGNASNIMYTDGHGQTHAYRVNPEPYPPGASPIPAGKVPWW